MLMRLLDYIINKIVVIGISIKEFISIYICKATSSIGEIRCLRIYLILGDRDLGRVDNKHFNFCFTINHVQILLYEHGLIVHKEKHPWTD